MKRYIINGNVCLQSKVKKVDIEINNNVISNIGVNIEKVEGAEIIDAKGLTVIPGIIDFHTHLEEKGQLFNQIDTYSSGSKLAILNGITTINAFIVQNFNQSLAQAITSVAAQAENNTYCDYRWHLTPTRFSDINFSDISRWIDKGFKTFKFYTTYKTANLYLSYDRINEIIRRLKKYEPQIIIHCEDETIMNQMYIKHDFHDLSNYTKIHSEEAELTAIEKIIQLCKSIQTPIHIAHVSSSDAIGQIELAKRDCPITCETTPHYIFLNENRLQKDNKAHYFLTPPLRSEECRNYMEIKTSMGYPEILCSNHKAYSDDIYKSFVNDYRSMPSGMPSLGVLFPLFYDLLVKKHEWDLPKLMKKLSFNPANMAQIYPKKGTIAVGSDADLVIFDPNGKPRTVTSSLAKQYNAWSDFTTNVEIKEVLLRGTTVVKNGKLVNEDKRIGQALCDTNI
ncbi:MAG: amidohydrolase family protein [Candidatus Cloacimonadales bacterium]|jgi:dihydropyrimidinase|nr:amidohydrolase family protein [Candidatus Cloacimonadota bacterium]MDD2650766.1 amidohydrolase family protein [Candidatus Cloacimonadota bacterium]MDD3501204.1 amidohydrolase family protein [Candidatus Cloacimonadota bacterium]MDX9977419.1 amidohydrolase family protein [Candidatus Cloacimonadales bacterium]